MLHSNASRSVVDFGKVYERKYEKADKNWAIAGNLICIFS